MRAWKCWSTAVFQTGIDTLQKVRLVPRLPKMSAGSIKDWSVIELA
jgi:hypothetical protein